MPETGVSNFERLLSGLCGLSKTFSRIKSPGLSGFGTVGILILGFVIFLGLFAPYISPFDPWDYSAIPLEKPSDVHPLGTNDIGQDILSELLYGARTSLLFGFFVALMATVFSVLVGVCAGLSEGFAGKFLMLLTDIFIAIPSILLILLLAAYIKPDFLSLILILSFFSWQYGARVLYSQSLSLKERPYIYAAKNFGAKKLYLISRHLVPDLFPLLLSGFIQRMRYAVFMEAGLAFMGISDLSTKSWGLMMNRAMEFVYIGTWKWWLLPTGFLLSLTILGFSLLGYFLEEHVDKRHRKIK
ncbi:MULTISPECIES: ABC transporter permease [unclassified Methanosarcina]|uniref:ABC transporter permease n=1 Tax=unclassified Methanosarcina TaxID=2644672 RepID=UPI00061560BC|nr:MULTISPECIES: ABC transporter permease [unclassified Methanosarcina]AKB20118.1 Oligopeptide transport system permease protein OppC [Methanosarcina sp. WWM596]AKB21686.1 Oligopeptide transport system permease protein OppC [Methanosarcina sp. WH1]